MLRSILQRECKNVTILNELYSILQAIQNKDAIASCNIIKQCYVLY